jgi:hypothetical protein
VVFLKVTERQAIQSEQAFSQPASWPEKPEPGAPYPPAPYQGPFRTVVRRERKVRVTLSGCNSAGEPQHEFHHWCSFELSPEQATPFELESIWMLSKMPPAPGADAPPGVES